MTTLEKIRAEIEQIIPIELPCDKRTPENIRDMALEIIDKYASEECDRDCEHCAYLECPKEPTTRQSCEACIGKSRYVDGMDLCEDCELCSNFKPKQTEESVSRQAVLKGIADYVADGWAESPSDINAISALVNELPSVQPKAKTGRWSRKTKVDAYDIAGVKTWGIKCQCDRCDFTTIVVEDFGYYKYCPNCGVEMKGGEE